MFEFIGRGLMNNYYEPIMAWWAEHLTLLGVVETALGLLVIAITVMWAWIIHRWFKFERKQREKC